MEAISGCLRRLEYFGGLRAKNKTKDTKKTKDAKDKDKDKDSEYEHWGLARVYGDLPAMRALAQTHRSLVSQILATPLRALLEEVEITSGEAGLPATSYIQRFENPDLNLLPPSPGAGSARHLNSVLQALSALAKDSKRNAIRRAS